MNKTSQKNNILAENVETYEIKRLKSDFKRSVIKSSQDAYDFIKSFYGDDISIYESFFMVTLDSQLNTTGFVKIGQGSLNACLVDKRLLAFYAVKSLSTSIIIAHNHPTGIMKPSQSDLILTESLIKAMELLDISIHDHLIIGESSYYSMADEGVLEFTSSARKTSHT